ncbi:hypothetical protein [Subtercola boreus]|uniref:AraC-like ligand-binding domain-containing protein n=1 Tax=Subtercola boreus TaxID=120213 RepID=UPI001558F7FA|nr:hypothetical protein [Subtercola boreus]
MRRNVRLPLSSRTADARSDRERAKLAGAAHALVENRRFGDGTLWSFDGVEVAELRQEATPSIPIFQHETREDGGRVAVIFLREGEVAVSHDGALFRFSAGSAAFFSSGSTTSVEALTFCRVALVSVPLNTLREAGVHVAKAFGPFSYSTAQGSPLLSFLTALIEVVEGDSIPAQPTATVLQQLVTDFFRRDAQPGAHSRGADLDVRAFAASLAVLRGGESAEQGTLSPRELARRAGFPTERELGRAFTTAYGATVRKVLLSQVSAPASPAAPASEETEPATTSPADSPERASVRPGDRTG